MGNKAAAFDLAHELDPEVRAQFFDGETENSLTDVVRSLWESHTPGWLFYYLSEVEKPANMGEQLLELLDDETINDVARRYADADGPIINMNNPASHNWMSEDPMGPVRQAYEEKRAEIGGALVTAYADTFDDIDHFHDEEFRAWFREECLAGLNLLQWAVHEQEADQRGADNSTRQVAEWWVARTLSYKLVDVLATYDARNEDLDAYLDAKEQYSKYDREWAMEKGYLADADADADDPEVPTFIAKPLPSRDVDIEKLKERSDSDLPL